jgi:photosystem II stability/assembly factor-like uncharacterized protein
MTKLTWHKVDGPAVIFSLGRLGKEGWLAGTNEGLWRYHDGSLSVVSEALRAAAITATAAPDNYPHTNLIMVGSVDGIARTIDGGHTWMTGIMTQVSQVSQIVLSPAYDADSIIFATTLEDGVLRTHDGGDHWYNWNFGLLDLETLSIAVSPDFAKDETVYVATGTGIFRSLNGGRAWRELAFAGEGPEAEEALPPTGIVVTNDMVIVSTESKGLFYSRDRGDTWFKRNAFRSGQTSTIATSQDATKVLLATPAAIAISADSGATWERIAKPPDSVISIGIGDDGAVLCGTQEDGLWVYR